MGVVLKHTESATEIHLGDNVVWRDRFNHNPIPQSIEIPLDGAAIIEYLGQYAGGQPITLDCGGLSKSLGDQLTVLKNDLNKQDLSLNLYGEIFSCTWNHTEGNAVSMVPVREQTFYSDGDLFEVTIFLIEK